MQVTRKDNSTTNVTLTINGGPAELGPIKRHVLSHFIDKVKVPGFRAGKAPLEMVERNVNQQQLLDEFMEHAINDLFRKAVDEQKLRPVGQPDVSLKKFVPYNELEFQASFDIIGAISLPNYKTIKLAKPKVDITAKEVDEVIASLRQRLAQKTDVDRPSKIGDEVWLDFSGKDKDGKPVAGADGKDYPLILGSNTFIPGFEDNLIGVKTGDEKKFDVTFPKDYGIAALQSKKVTFSVEIKKVQELKQPDVNDDFAKQAANLGSVKELKDDIKKQVKAEKQLQADREYENELIKKISDKASVEIPPALIEEQILQMEEEEKRNLTYRGLTWQEHLQQENITQEQHRERQRPDAEARVKAGLVLSEISQKEGVGITPEELEIRLQILKGQYQDPQMQAELDKPEVRQDIAARLMTEKAINKLIDYASK